MASSLCALNARATLHVYMYPTPVTVTAGSFGTSNEHDIDVNNDGIDDIRIDVTHTSTDYYYVAFESLNNQPIEAEYINGNEAIAYNCQANFGVGAGWSSSAKLAEDISPNQFDGKGPRYMALRREYTPYPFQDFVYGWLKVECPDEANQFTIYGYGYEDTPGYTPTLKAGQGECFNIPTAINDVLPSAAVIVHEGKIILESAKPVSIRLFDTAGRRLNEYQTGTGKHEFLLPVYSGLMLLEISDGIKPRTIKIIQR